MFIFSLIFLSFAGLLLVASGVCWAVFIAADNSDWRRLGVKIFRLSMVCLLFYVNVAIIVHIVSALRGDDPAALKDDA